MKTSQNGHIGETSKDSGRRPSCRHALPTALLVLLALCTVPVQALGQETEEPAVRTSRTGPGGDLGNSNWNNLGRLKPGQKVEVVQSNLSKHKGKFVTWSEETLVLRTKKREISIPRDEVFRVTLLAARRRRNALIGAVVGLASGIPLGWLSYKLAKDETGNPQVAAVVPSALFAGVGAGIGASIPSHRTIYRARKKGASQ